MRKFLVVVAVALAAAQAGRCAEESGKPAYWLPYWGCTDKEALAAMEKTATDDVKKTVFKFHADLAENGAPSTWSELETRIDAAARAVNPEFADGEGARRIVKQYARNTNQNGKWTRDLIAYSKRHPCSYDFHVAQLDNSEWGWVVVTDNILKYEYLKDEVMTGLDYIVRQGIALEKPDAYMRDLFKRLNRVYSAMLVRDRSWETIVAQIRTLLETYD